MNVDQFYETLDSYFARQEIDKVDPFLVSSLQQAKEEEDYAAYISICNEMIGFYRSISAFEIIRRHSDITVRHYRFMTACYSRMITGLPDFIII